MVAKQRRCRNRRKQFPPFEDADAGQQLRPHRGGALVIIALVVATCASSVLALFHGSVPLDAAFSVVNAADSTRALAGPHKEAGQMTIRARDSSRVQMTWRQQDTRDTDSPLYINGHENPYEAQRLEILRNAKPEINNMKDQHYILFVRSIKVKEWLPLNIISGSELVKNMKGVKDNDIAKAIGADKIADGQIIKAIGMSIYNNAEDAQKQAVKVHEKLKSAKELQFGFREISDNARFNEDPWPFAKPRNVTLIPPEAELKNVMDTAAESMANMSKGLTNVGDSIKNMFTTNAGGR